LTEGRATAVAHGAATIVNAIALGKGAAFGVDLWTKAEVRLTDEPQVIRGEIASDPSESTILIERAVARVLQHFRLEKRYGATVKTQSNIPIARGLKSSSVAANAVVLATTAALGKKMGDLESVNLGVDAAFDAKVTVTGAFDDACASYFGGVVITDNLNRKLIKQTAFPEDLVVLFHVPAKKAYTGNSNVAKLQTVKPLVEVAYNEAAKSNYWTALSLNGLIYSNALGYNTAVALDTLGAGAVAAGLCGKGPAVTAVVSQDKVNQVKEALQRHEGDILQTKLNTKKANVV
jgi:shikimate kinase